MKYFVEVSCDILRYIEKFQRKDVIRIIEKIESLAINPRPIGCIKMRGSKYEETYRVRTGDYRIIYSIEENKMAVLIVDVDHRKDIYKK